MNQREFCIVFRALGYTDKLISQLRPDANLILEAEDRLLCGYTRLYDIRMDSHGVEVFLTVMGENVDERVKYEGFGETFPEALCSTLADFVLDRKENEL